MLLFLLIFFNKWLTLKTCFFIFDSFALSLFSTFFMNVFFRTTVHKNYIPADIRSLGFENKRFLMSGLKNAEASDRSEESTNY